jgi:hypothetical protein
MGGNHASGGGVTCNNEAVTNPKESCMATKKSKSGKKKVAKKKAAKKSAKKRGPARSRIVRLPQ